MARGRPAVWSALVGLPFLAAGIWVFRDATNNPGAILTTDVAYALVGFSLFVVLVGAYIERVAPEPPVLRDDESVIDRREPTQRGVIVFLLLSVPFFVATAYYYYATQVPYAIPTTTLAIGFVLFINGLVTYWRNTLTTYYVTTHRVLSEYRFLSLRRREIPINRIRSIEEQQSIMETLTRAGNVRVVSGGGRNMTITIRDVNHSSELADVIRGLQ